MNLLKNKSKIDIYKIQKNIIIIVLVITIITLLYLITYNAPKYYTTPVSVLSTNLI